MDHPNALEFLRKDCNNVNDFFRRKNVAVLTLKGLFDFVTDPTITADNVDRYLEEAQVTVEYASAGTRWRIRLSLGRVSRLILLQLSVNDY